MTSIKMVVLGKGCNASFCLERCLQVSIFRKVSIFRGGHYLLAHQIVFETHLSNKLVFFSFQDSPQEQIILWDVTRTFPAHPKFKDAGGEGQSALYKISKVSLNRCYAVEIRTSDGLLKLELQLTHCRPMFHLWINQVVGFYQQYV